MKRFMTRKVRWLLVWFITLGSCVWFYLANVNVDTAIGVGGGLIFLPFFLIATFLQSAFFLIFIPWVVSRFKKWRAKRSVQTANA